MRTTALIFFILCCTAAAAQTPNRTPEQIRRDSIDREKHKKLYPEMYRFNRAPYQLLDSSYVIMGFIQQFRLEDNVIVDSIHNNFHTDMPDTTTFTPYSSISVGGPRVKVSYLVGTAFNGLGPGSLVPYTHEAFEKDSIDVRNGADTAKGIWMVPQIGRLRSDDVYYVRITLNGKPVLDWTEIRVLPSVFLKGTERFKFREPNTKGMPLTQSTYGDAYTICDTTLNVNDQLLIELKERNRNWMLERLNFTRVPATPRVSAVRITGEDGRTTAILSAEKKTLDLAPATRTSR